LCEVKKQSKVDEKLSKGDKKPIKENKGDGKNLELSSRMQISILSITVGSDDIINQSSYFQTLAVI
jgi:hypothetical protein